MASPVPSLSATRTNAAASETAAVRCCAPEDSAIAVTCRSIPQLSALAGRTRPHEREREEQLDGHRFTARRRRWATRPAATTSAAISTAIVPAGRLRSPDRTSSTGGTRGPHTRRSTWPCRAARRPRTGHRDIETPRPGTARAAGPCPRTGPRPRPASPTGSSPNGQCGDGQPKRDRQDVHQYRDQHRSQRSPPIWVCAPSRRAPRAACCAGAGSRPSRRSLGSAERGHVVARDASQPAARNRGCQLADRAAVVVGVAGEHERPHVDPRQRGNRGVDERVEDVDQRDRIRSDAGQICPDLGLHRTRLERARARRDAPVAVAAAGGVDDRIKAGPGDDRPLGLGAQREHARHDPPAPSE